MRAFFISIATLLCLSWASAATAPDLKDLLQQAANAAKERQSQQDSGQADGSTGATQQTGQQQQSSQQQQSTQSSSQSGLGGMLGGLLGGLSGNSSSSSGSGTTSGGGLSGLGQVGNIISGLISSSNVTAADLVGNWRYSQPAIAFESSNFLQKAGGAAASSVIIEKLTPYYNKAGIDRLKATFNNACLKQLSKAHTPSPTHRSPANSPSASRRSAKSPWAR